MVETKIKRNKIELACSLYKKAQKSRYKKFKKLDDWIEKESKIFYKETTKKTQVYPNFKRGAIIKVDFGVNIGSELCYTHYAIVLNKNDTNGTDNISVVPLTSKKQKNCISLGKILQTAMPSTNKYIYETYADIPQIRVISKKRILNNKLKYVCSNEVLDKIDKAIINYFTK